MTWENVKRAKKKAANRRRHHETQIASAPTPRRQLWAACAWLISEAWQAGLIDDALDWVLGKVHDIREKEAHTDDHHDYAA